MLIKSSRGWSQANQDTMQESWGLVKWKQDFLIMTCNDEIRTKQRKQHSYLEPSSLYMYFYIHMYLKFRQWHWSQPLMTHPMWMTKTHCHWLFRRWATAQQKLVNVLLIQVTETSKNTMLSSCRPMPKSSWSQHKEVLY